MSKTRDTTCNSAENQRRWADPEYRARVSAKISAGLKRRNENPAARQTLVDRWNAPGYRERVGQSMSAGQQPEYRAQRAARVKPKDPFVCGEPVLKRQRLTCGPVCESARHAAAGARRRGEKRAPQSEAAKAKIGAHARLMWQQKTYREAVASGVRGANRKPEVQKKRSDASRRMWADPEHARSHAVAVAHNSHVGRYEHLDVKGRLWTFKSGDQWERGFARWLDAQGLTWAYEPHTLLLSDGRRYVPDFWVEEWKTYVELKGPHLSADKANQAIADGHPVKILQGLPAIRAFQASLVESPA